MALFQPGRASASSGTAFQPSGEGTSSAAASQAGRANTSGYEAVRASRDFWTIKRRFGSFVGPACMLFIVWYFLFVIIAVSERGGRS